MVYEQALKKGELNYKDSGNNGWTFPEIIGVSESISQIRKTIERIGPTDLNVIIYGDNGTGKDLVAEALHWNSKRVSGPFIKVSPLMIPCDDGGINEAGDGDQMSTQELESNLNLVFDSATNGTLFIDRIQEVPPRGQVTLLRFFRSLEGVAGRDSDGSKKLPRFFASSTQDLAGLAQEGMFRADLFHRLNEISIYLPPLRERKEDIGPLSEHFLRFYAKMYKKKIPSVCSQTFELFHQYGWPGNVRELRNIIHRLVVLGNEKQIQDELWQSIDGLTDTRKPMKEIQPSGEIRQPQSCMRKRPGKEEKVFGEAALSESLKDISQRVVEKVEMEAILKVLEYTHWHRKKAARLLGVNYRTLLNKIRKYGLGENLET